MDHIWTVDMVATELIDSIRLCQRISGRVRPSDRTGYWPDVLRTWGDMLASVEGEEPIENGPIRFTATSKQVTRMERVIDWQARYLAGSHNDVLRRVLALWLRAKCMRGKSFSHELKKRSWSKATAYRVRDRALLLIAIGLMKDGVKPGGSGE